MTAVLCCRSARETGIWDRWCKVQTTYCRGAQRAREVLNSPFYMRMGAPPEAITAQLKSIMGSFKVGEAAALVRVSPATP